MKEIIVKVLTDLKLGLDKQKIFDLIETPPNSEMGDFAFPCFSLAKEMKKNPVEIAKELSKKINEKKLNNFEKIIATGPYLNFFADKKKFSENILKEVLKTKEKFGFNSENKIGKVMTEFPSPNTNKPLHLGHLRNMTIGESMSRILEFNGNQIFRVNSINDRGIHICKSMLAYLLFGKNKKPDKKSDHFVGDFYVMFAKAVKEKPELEKEAQDMLVKWEGGDKNILALWKKMNKWALDGQDETYKRFGIKFDKTYYESKVYTKGKDIVLDGLKKGIFKKKDDGAIVIDLKDEGLDEKVLLRSDGTSVYITYDLSLAKLKDDDFKLDGSIYVVGNEQEYYFKVLFLVLKKLGFKFADHLKHLSYGMVELPEGKMKSREGTVVDADDLIDEVMKLSEEDLKERYKDLSKKEIENRALKIALAAIKYKLVRVDIFKNMVFDPKESVSFEGDTGPYLLYSYARANSILKKTKNKKNDFQIDKVEKSEFELIKKINEFQNVVKESYEKYNPSLVAHYSYGLAQLFNEFYHACSVIDAEKNCKEFRIALVEAFKITLKNSLNLLGIDVLEEM